MRCAARGGDARFSHLFILSMAACRRWTRRLIAALMMPPPLLPSPPADDKCRLIDAGDVHFIATPMAPIKTPLIKRQRAASISARRFDKPLLGAERRRRFTGFGFASESRDDAIVGRHASLQPHHAHAGVDARRTVRPAEPQDFLEKHDGLLLATGSPPRRKEFHGDFRQASQVKRCRRRRI